MTYHTILVYLTDQNSASHVLDAAIALAKKNDSHLIGLHIVPTYPSFANVGMELSVEIHAAQKTMMETDEKIMSDIFENATRNQSINVEWRCMTVDSFMLLDTVIEHCRCVDLVICGQSDPSNSLESDTAISEKILLETGRPVLLIPYAGNHEYAGEHITVAWNASREATRAVFDAMPFLSEAKDVNLLWINPQAVNGRDTDTPGSEIATCLARHGVNAVAGHSISGSMSISNELLSRMADSGSDMLVMGGYGHSRFREFIFGGATSDILKSMTVPVLMSH